jgi:predicted RNA-binding protein YlxR (DUF448 family)
MSSQQENSKQVFRTCMGTGIKLSPAQLVRYTNVKGVPTPDVPGQPKRPGRGAYLQPTPEALAAALKKKAFARHLKTNQPPLMWGE